MKRKKSSVDPNAWMATYGDMVTLLLCFFVLLYSMSSIDQVKWENIVKSFNPNADKVSQVVVGDPTEGEDDVGAQGTEGELPLDSMEQLFLNMQEFIEENQLSEEMDVFEGEDYLFVTFRNSIFFDGDSSVLRAENEPILEFLGNEIKAIQDDVWQIKVYGHTNQSDPNNPNNIENDRNLSALRAAAVVSFLQRMDIIHPKDISGEGFGQHYPIAPFVGEENRQLNRRVEILITETDAVLRTLEQIYEEMGQEIIEE